LAPLQREPAPPRTAIRVLVVEDEFLIAMELEAALEDAGFHVVGPLLSVASALERILIERPDAAVLDVSLRGERVTPVADALLAMRVPYVLTTAYAAADLAGEPSLARARNVGKPAPPGQLVKALHELISGQADDLSRADDEVR
jgi:DNA-binding NtrC family response regulator